MKLPARVLSRPVSCIEFQGFDRSLARELGDLRFMASVTSNATAANSLAKSPAGLNITRIEPPRGWFDLCLKELWDYRELLYFFVWRDVKIRYKQTAIGVLWVVLQPLLTMIVANIFFHKLAKIPSPGLPYTVFCFAALVPWTYFSTSLLNATNVVVENQRVITKSSSPRLILPFSAVLSGLVDLAVAFIVLLIFTLSYGIRPTVTALLLPLFLLLAVLDGFGSWPVAFRSQCALSRCALSLAVHRPVLDSGFARLLSEFDGAGALPLDLRAESHDWRD